MKNVLALVAASALCLALALAAHANEVERIFSETRTNVFDDAGDLGEAGRGSVRLGLCTAGGAELELFGVIDREREVSGLVAVVKKDGQESIVPLDIMYDFRYEPELAAASPSGGAPDEVLLRVFAGGGTGVYIEELYLLRPYVGGVDVTPFEPEQLARLASELVDIRVDGSKATFVRSSKAGDAGSLLFTFDAESPIRLGDPDDAAEHFYLQVRYRFDSTGRALVGISPTLSTEEMPVWCDETIEFDVHVSGGSFSLSDPRVAKEEH